MVAYSFYEADNRVRRYAETLARRGDRVDVVSLRQNGQPPRGIINGVHVFRIQRRVVNERSKFSYLGRLLLFFIRSMAFLSVQQMKERYDLVHVHSVPDFEVFAAIVPKLTGSKIILDIHDLVPEFYLSKFSGTERSLTFRLLTTVERVSARFSDHVIAANHIWEKRLQNRSVKESKCTTILNFPDTEIFQARGRTRTDNRFVILYPGTLNYHQGIDIAIRALALIKDQVPEAEFHIYGSGEQLNPLRALVKELELEKRVFLMGTKPLHEISSVIENADLGVVPKRSNSFGNEAFSTKILEFMSLGVPVVVPDTAIDSYYFNNSVVKFFRANDEQSLADAILLMIKNPELRQKFTRDASEFVRKYSWDMNKDTYLNLVDSLVQSSNGRVTVEKT
ncbi:MAG: glycosyltransferase family 4 protein [Candidatus Acidiferrales bacterium]|jgi:glycosyltransferase involved in cell wall biosynthesis